MATALLQPVNDSGVSAELTLYESEDGTMLTVLGIATGMRILGQYLSLARDSEGFPPEKPSSEDPTCHSPSLGTLLGRWKGPLGTRVGTKRTLQITRPTSGPSGVHLYEMNIVSIRHSSTRLGRDPTHDMNAQRCPLVACGEILRVP